MSTEPIAALHAALAAAQGELTNPKRLGVVEAGRLRYAFVRLEDLEDAARPVLARHGIARTYTMEPLDGPHVWVVLHLSMGGATIEGARLPVQVTGKAQEVGSVITYARRYLLGMALGVATDTDNDARAIDTAKRGADEARAPKPVEPTPQQRDTAELRALAKRAGITAEVKGDVARYFGAQYNLAPDAPPGQWLGVLRAFDRAQGISNLIDAVIAWDSRTKADEADKESDEP
jgi:hypothetical protein